MARSEDLKTPLARLSFPNLLKPQVSTNDAGQKVEKYNCVLLFPKTTDIGALKQAAAKAIEEAWGDKGLQMLKSGLIKSPFLDGDGPQGLSKKSGERHAGYEGTTFIRCATTLKPKVVDKKVQPVISEDEVYAGCYVYAVINAYTWDNPKNGKGVSFGVNMVQVAKDGERLGGGGLDPSAHFEAIPEDNAPAGGSAVNSAADMFG
jgi:hypothetical protein